MEPSAFFSEPDFCVFCKIFESRKCEEWKHHRPCLFLQKLFQFFKEECGFFPPSTMLTCVFVACMVVTPQNCFVINKKTSHMSFFVSVGQMGNLRTFPLPLGFTRRVPLPVLTVSAFLPPRMTVRWAARTWTALSPPGSQLSRHQWPSPVRRTESGSATRPPLKKRMVKHG